MATLFRPLYFVRIFGRNPLHPDAHVNMRALFDFVPPVASPFAQRDWPLPARGATTRPIPKFTVTRPLEPYQPPFFEDNWPLPVKGKPKAVGDTADAYAARNNGAPFVEEEWRLAARSWPKAIGETVDAYAARNTIVAVVAPFSVSEWPNAKSRLAVQGSDLSPDMLAVLQPNPAQPFVEDEWRSPA